MIDAVDQGEQRGAALDEIAGGIGIGPALAHGQDGRLAELPIILQLTVQFLIEGGFAGLHGRGALFEGAVGFGANGVPLPGFFGGGLGVTGEQVIAQNNGRLIYAGADLFEQLDAAQVGVAHFAGMDVHVVNSENGVGGAGYHQQQ